MSLSMRTNVNVSAGRPTASISPAKQNQDLPRPHTMVATAGTEKAGWGRAWVAGISFRHLGEQLA